MSQVMQYRQLHIKQFKDASLDNVKYLELRFTPTHFAVQLKKFNEEDVILWIKEAIEKASKRI